MEWKSRISGCFGEIDRIFAVHPLDKRRASELLVLLVREQVPYTEFMRECEVVLEDAGCDQRHLDEQLARVSDKFKAWLV